MYFDIHKQFLDPDHVARQATEAERKLQSYHYEVRVKDGIGTSMHTTQGKACHHGEPYRLWLQWNGQWHQGPPLSPRNQEY